MGTCYSGLGSKSLSVNQTPIDPKVKTIIGQKDSQINSFEIKLKSNKEFNFNHFSSSFEDLSIDTINDRKGNKTSMSSQTNRNKIPIPSTKVLTNNKVVPKRSEEFVLNKYKTHRYDASVDVNKVMIFDNSSTTSISSDSSLHLSKSSLKSTSSSTSNSGRPQTTKASIPKPSVKSRTPTPPIPIKYAANPRKGNKLSQNSTSLKPILMSDRMNGNSNDGSKTDNKSKNRNVTIEENNPSKTREVSSYGTSIRYTTQMSGLPRPQTAHIVSTSSHSTDNTINHKINASNDIESRFKQYSDTNPNSRCDPNLRQIKPYYYGMGVNNKPYERPNHTNNTFNKIQFQPKNTNQPKIQFNPMFSQNINQKLKSIPTNTSHKSKLEFGSNNYRNVKQRDDSSSIKSTALNNRNQNHINSNEEIKTQTNDNISQKSNENTFLPKSIQRVRELAPHFLTYNKIKSNIKEKGVDSVDTLPTSPEHNSISSSVGANSEADNRDFLIDDEICDQPELVLSSNIDKKDLVKNLNSELEGLILKQESGLSPPTPSSPNISCLSTASSTSTLVPTSSTTFRKPRPLSLVEMPDGSLGLDSPSFRAASQDLIGIKTLLFRLHGLLQNAETLNPFDSNYSPNKFYNQLSIAENEVISSSKEEAIDLKTENLDLKRQIVLQQQIIEDKDRTIRLLQQQMAKYSNINTAYIPQTMSSEKVNACCQTDRCRDASNIDPRAVSDGSNGMLVSVCCSHQILSQNQSKDPNPQT